MTEEEKADARAAIEEEDRLAEEEAIRHAKREQRHARVLVALFSVALLWCSSFAVSDAIVEALLVIPHAPHDVLVNVNETYVHVKNAERLYAACATFQTKGCVDNVRAAARVESSRARRVERVNAAVVAAAEAEGKRCVDADETLARLLRVAQAAIAPRDVPWKLDSNLCGPDARDAVRARIVNPGDALAGVSDDIATATSAYRTDSEAAVNRTTGLVVERAGYDGAYKDNKSVALDRLQVDVQTNMSTEASKIASNVDFHVGSLELDAGAYLRATALEAADALEFVKDAAMAAVRAYVLTVEALAEAVIKLIRKAASWFKAFNEIGAAADALNIGITPDMTPPRVPILNPFNIPDLPPDIAPRVDAMHDVVTARTIAIANAADAARADLVGDVARIPETAIGCLAAAGVPTFFDDYDPPPRGDASTTNATSNASAIAYAERERAEAEARGERFENQTNATAALVENERSELRRDANETRGNVTDEARNTSDAASAAASEAAANIKEKLGNASDSDGPTWLGVAPPNLENVESAMRVLSALFDALLAADLVYRVVRSFQAVAKHFSHKNSLPPIDLTAKNTTEKEDEKEEEKTLIMRYAEIVGHPIVLVAVRVVAVSLAVTLITYAYLPFHKAYRTGCITGCDGTFTTMNMHSFAHNYIAAEGSRISAAGVLRAEAERRDQCAAHAPSTAATLATARVALDAVDVAKTSAASTASMLVNCVDAEGYADAATAADDDDAAADVFTSDDLDAMRGMMKLASEAWIPCSSSDATLNATSLFECEALPKCNLTCGGPNRLMLATLTHISGCAVEGVVHAYALKTVLVTVVFFAANWARDIAVNGYAALWWRELCGNRGFRFEGTLRADGSAVKPEIGRGRTLAKVARAKLRWQGRKHTASGYWSLFIAMLAQVPGFAALLAARRSSLVTTARCTTAYLARKR